jgi:hypothetical protein
VAKAATPLRQNCVVSQLEESVSANRGSGAKDHLAEGELLSMFGGRQTEAAPRANRLS